MVDFSKISTVEITTSMSSNSNGSNDEIKVGKNKICELAIEIWKFKKRLSKYDLKVSDDQRDIINNSLNRILRFFETVDLTIEEFTENRFDDGMNLEIIDIKSNPMIQHPVIVETIEPQISFNNKLYKKSKVLIEQP